MYVLQKQLGQIFDEHVPEAQVLGANAEILSVRYKTVLTSISNISLLQRM